MISLTFNVVHDRLFRRNKNFDTARKKRSIKTRITEDWISIGFQDKDPATDFRGAGSLGLENLYEFTCKKYCDEVFQVASNPES